LRKGAGERHSRMTGWHVGSSGDPSSQQSALLVVPRVAAGAHREGSQNARVHNPSNVRTFKKMGASADQFRFFALVLFTFFLRSFMARVGWMPAMVNAVRTDLGGSDLFWFVTPANAIALCGFHPRCIAVCSRGEKGRHVIDSPARGTAHSSRRTWPRHSHHHTKSDSMATDATCSGRRRAIDVSRVPYRYSEILVTLRGTRGKQLPIRLVQTRDSAFHS
jgi:hypothetical protein